MGFHIIAAGNKNSRLYLDYISSKYVAVIEYDPSRTLGKRTRRLCVASVGYIEMLQDFCDEHNAKREVKE